MEAAPISSTPVARVGHVAAPLNTVWQKYGTPILVIMLAVAIVVTLTRNWNAWEGQRIEQATNDAYVRRDVTPLSTKVAGLVRVVNVTDYQRVHKGDELVVLEDGDYRAQVAQAAAAVEAAKAALENNRRQRELQDARIARALAGAQINLGYTRVVAPADGTIGERQVRPGQLVSPGTQVMPFVDGATWVQANFRETQLTNISVGQIAEVRVDVYPGEVARGKVLEIAPASGSQFALLPPDNATGNFTKVVQRVPVKIALDDSPLTAKLRPGLSAVVTVRTRN